MSKEIKVGELLDSLGLTAPVANGDMVTDAIVVMKSVKPDGTVVLLKGRSEALDWITALGMLTAAVEIESGGYERADEDDG